MRQCVSLLLALAFALASLMGVKAQPGAPPLICVPGQTLMLTGDGAPPTTELLLHFSKWAVGGGFSDAAGAYTMPLTVGQERPGTYAILIETRGDQVVVATNSCLIPGGGVTAIPADSATPRPTGPTAFPSSTLPLTPTASPTSPLLTRPVSDFDHNGDGKVTCADFDTQAAAREALNAGYVSLDEDRDGIPCESLPVGP